MPDSIKIKNAETCWKIENLGLLRQKRFTSSPSDIFLNKQSWYFTLNNYGLDGYFHIYACSRQGFLLEDGERFTIRISKNDGSSYIDENAVEHTTDLGTRCYINPTPLTNLLDIENILSKDGSLSVFISLVTDTALNPNQQADVLDMDTHKILVPSRNVSTQTMFIEGVETLSEDFKKLLANGRHTDVKIIVEGKEFQAHKCVLSARSTVLDSMFSQQMLENINGVVNISDCDSKTFEDFLTFLYSGKLDGIISSRILGIYEIADKYDIQDLKKECVKRCIIEMSVDSVCDALRIAALHVQDEAELMEKATNFFVENTQDILKSSKWEVFHEEYPRIANELFLKSFMSLNLSKTSK